MNHFRVYDVLLRTDLDVPCDGASLSEIDGQSTIDMVLRHRIRTLHPPRSLAKINEKFGGQLASFATRTGILLSLSDHSMLHVDDNRRIITNGHRAIGSDLHYRI